MYLTGRLLVRVVLAVIIVLGLSTSLLADSILYNFTGSNNLTGSFTLDSAAPFTTTSPDGQQLDAVLTSPNQTIWGTYGSYTFTGAVKLQLVRQPVFYANGTEALAPDYWIIRATLAGPLIGGSSPFLNLFVYTKPGTDCGGPNVPVQLYGPCVIDGALTPPTYVSFGPASPPSFNIGYIPGPFGWGGGSGSLSSLTMVTDPSTTNVPEPSTLVLLSMGFVGVGLFRRRALTNTHPATEYHNRET